MINKSNHNIQHQEHIVLLTTHTVKSLKILAKTIREKTAYKSNFWSSPVYVKGYVMVAGFCEAPGVIMSKLGHVP